MLIDVKGRPITPREVERGLLISTIAGAVGMVFFTVTGGAYVTGFARKLGASQFQVGIINAFLPMAALAQLASSYMIERRGWLRRPILCIAASVMRILWIPIALMPFIFHYTRLGAPSDGARTAAVTLVLVLMAMAQLLNSFGGLAWQAWMGDLIPAEKRGRFFGARTAVMNAVFVVVGIAAGRYLDVHDSFSAFALIFGLGVFFGVTDLVIHAFVPEPKPHLAPTTQPFMRMFLHPFRDPSFSGLIWFNVAWSFSVWVMLPFLPVFQIETLKMSYLSISSFSNVFMGSMMLASYFGGSLVDRIGGRTIYIWSFSLMSAFPLLWILTTRANSTPMQLLMNIESGVLNAVVAIATSKLLLENSPKPERSIYIAAFAAVTGLAGGIGPVLGGWVGDLVAHRSLALGPVAFSGLKIVFLVSLVLRLGCLPLLSMVAEGRDFAESPRVNEGEV